jgi:predicted AlkP superfamily phosphohydrolase/phosphomutase
MASHQRILVIGLDGVPLDLIQGWVARGYLPTLGKLIEIGSVGPLRSTMPPTSGPSWSAFTTGKNPGKTGVYDFLYRVPGTYQFAPVSAQYRQGPTLWQLLSEAGRGVGVLNVPVTYPTQPVNGFMISGFLTPYGAPDYIYPQALQKELEDYLGAYHIYPQATFKEHSVDAFFEASYELLEMRTRAALWLMAHHEWDLFMTVFFDTDRILHQLWHYIDPTHPWRKDDAGVDKEEAVIAYFQRLDESIGRLLDAVDDDTTVIVLSDHGMGAAHNFVILNNWLAEVGLLHFKRDPITAAKQAMFKAGFTLKQVHSWVDRLGLAKHAEYKALYSVDGLLKRFFLSFRNVDWSKTRAYSFGRHTGPIYVNVEGREPEGIVRRGAEYEAVRREITELARAFTEPGTDRPMIGQVVPREELYHGPAFDQAPDLTLLPQRETDIFFGLADFGDNHIVGPVYRYSGMHRNDGMLIARGPQILPGEGINGASIWDLAPTILYLMGIDIPRDMDGQVLGTIMTEYDRDSVRFSDNGGDTHGPDTDTVFSPEQEADIVERLRGLGYLG